MPLRFTFRQLEYFAAVGEAGTIAQAAQRLNVSSPSISAAIAQLEAEFGIQLFVRHHAQGLALTPGGRRIFNAAKTLLDDASALNDLAHDIADRPRGPLTLGALSTVAPLLSASIRRTFETAYPDASVALREGDQTGLLRMLGRAEIDVALTYDLEIPKDVAFEELVSLPPSVMLPADHPLAARETVALEELAREPMVLLDLPLSRDYFLAVFHDHGLQPDIAERTTDLSVARSLVANGFGFGLMNMRMRTDLAPDGARLATRSISGAVRPLGLGLASKRAERRPRILSAFFEHMRARAAAQDLPGVCSENSDGARP